MSERSTLEVGRIINRALAAKDGPIVPLIAETGGINAMIVDATALPEQVTDDVVASAFRSAGQRCSALRLLCVQDDVADRMIEMIAGAAKELSLGDPGDPSTHVGPVIDPEAKTRLDAWISGKADRIRFRWDKYRRLPQRGLYVPPTIIALDALTTVNLDFIRGYRPSTNVVARPTAGIGRGFSLTGHHELMLPLLAAVLIEQS